MNENFPIDSKVAEDSCEKSDEIEEEILIEPRFKYSRILADVAKIFETDGVSCIAVHDKFLLFGCKSGKICVFDHFGNAQLSVRQHKCAVSWISVDAAGHYFVSCANDYVVAVFGIGHDLYNQRLSVRKSARCVAIAEEFGSNSNGQIFVVAERDLTLYRRRFFGGQKAEVLYLGKSDDEWITAVSWRGSYIAFTNESGTRIYDYTLSRTITLVQPLHQRAPSDASSPTPRHSWLDATTLAIGWANTVCVCQILPHKSQGQLLYRWTIPNFVIGGISFTPWASEDLTLGDSIALDESQEIANGFISSVAVDEASLRVNSPAGSANRAGGPGTKWCEIAVFGVRGSASNNNNKASSSSSNPTEENQSNAGSDMSITGSDAVADGCAQLVLLQPVDVDAFQLAAEESIEMRGVNNPSSRFFLAALPQDNLYFLCGPRELIEAHPCSVDNRIAWLMENELHYEALACALKHRDQLQETSVIEVGRHLILRLMRDADFETAAKLLPQICSGQKAEWEFYVSQFEKYRQILKLSPVLPVGNPQLEPECYESVLTVALYSMPSLFLALIQQWNTDLYRVGFIRDKTISRMAENASNTLGSSGSSSNNTALSEEDMVCLYKVLAHLYVYERDFKRALEIYLLLRDPSIFSVIERHGLFAQVSDRIVEMMEINTDLTIRLLLDNENAVSTNKVVKLLNNHPKLQLAYLNKLQNRDEGAEYTDLLIRLYADNDRAKLLPFLRRAEKYKLDEALKICQKRNFVEEKIFLLGRSGNKMEALEEIVVNLNRIELAIEFCCEHGATDAELWERLIELAAGQGGHVLALLRAVGTFVDDASRIIEKIPSDLVIGADLKDALIHVLNEAQARAYVNACVERACTADLRDAMHAAARPRHRIFESTESGAPI